MSARDVKLQELLAGARIPPAHNREARVALILSLAEKLRDRKPVSEVERVFISAALLGWCEGGGNFDDYVRVAAPRGSHVTLPELVRRLRLRAASSAMSDNGREREQ